MKKNLLLGCMTALFLSPVLADDTVVINSPTPQEPIVQEEQTIQKPSTEEIKKSFKTLIETQTQLNQLLFLEDMTVTEQGNDFILSIPVFTKNTTPSPSDKPININDLPKKTFSLLYAGTFNGQAQYRIDSVFDTVQSLLQETLPEATISTEDKSSEILWVPYYNLITKNSQNIKNLKMIIPDVLNVTVGSLISDSLTRALNTQRIDNAGMQSIKDLTLTIEEMTLTVPTFSFKNEIQNALLVPSSIQQITSSDKSSFGLDIPTIIISNPINKDLMGSLSVAIDGLYQDKSASLNIKLHNISFNKTLLPLPSTLLPTEIDANADIKNLNTDLINLISNKDIPQETRADALRKLTSEILIQINKLEIKNTEAGIAITGTIQNKSNAIGLPLPEANLTAVITNLDKLSPEGKVDTQQCERIKSQMATVSDRQVAEQAIQNACMPQGGFLTPLRPYLDPQKRVINADGTTTDTLTITITGTNLIINGKMLQ